MTTTRQSSLSRLNVLWLTLAVTLTPLPASAQDADDGPLFEPEDAWYGAGFLLGTAALAPLDMAVADAIQHDRFQTSDLLGGTAGFFRSIGHPGALIVAGGLYGAGLATDDRTLAGIGLHTGEAIVIANAITYAGKVLIGRARPHLDTDDPFDFGLFRGWGNDDFRAFPSGHTTSAFAAAAALTTEVVAHEPDAGAWVGVVLYGAAALVGVSRLYHNEHWASDVLAGAAVGSFGGWKVVRWMHAHPNNELDRLLLPERPGRRPSSVVLTLWSLPLD